MHLTDLPTVLLVLFPLASSSLIHRSLPRPAGVIQQQAMITPSPARWSPTKTFKKRGVISEAVSKVEDDTKSILDSLGSDIPSYVASGVPNFFQDFPTGTAVQSSLSLNDSDVKALPTQVLNIP